MRARRHSRRRWSMRARRPRVEWIYRDVTTDPDAVRGQTGAGCSRPNVVWVAADAIRYRTGWEGGIGPAGRQDRVRGRLRQRGIVLGEPRGNCDDPGEPRDHHQTEESRNQTVSPTDPIPIARTHGTFPRKAHPPERRRILQAPLTVIASSSRIRLDRERTRRLPQPGS
jgi:hypothetical protein